MRIFQMTVALVMIELTGIGTTANIQPMAEKLVSDQTVEVSGITAIVRVGHEFGAYVVDGMWKQQPSGHYSIGCLDVYASLRYQLRDSGGRLVPINQKMLNQGEPLSMGGHATQNWKANCAAHPPHDSRLLLTNIPDRGFPSLYSDLRPGQYTLQLTFAPAGIPGKAMLKPVPITIPPN